MTLSYTSIFSFCFFLLKCHHKFVEWFLSPFLPPVGEPIIRSAGNPTTECNVKAIFFVCGLSFKFERETTNKEDRFYVTFRGGIACTSYDWLPYGRQEWTKKPFYEFMMAFKEKKAK